MLSLSVYFTYLLFSLIWLKKNDHCCQNPQDEGRHRSLREKKKNLSKIPLIGSKLLNAQLLGAPFNARRQAFTALTLGRERHTHCLEELLVGKTFWRAIWQPVSKASIVFDLMTLLLAVDAAETVQAKVWKMYV